MAVEEARGDEEKENGVVVNMEEAEVEGEATAMKETTPEDMEVGGERVSQVVAFGRWWREG